jgi:hypothetical protein
MPASYITPATPRSYLLATSKNKNMSVAHPIIGLFTATLDQLGVHWTRSTKFIVSVYRKTDTARLDEFVGPKHRAVPWTNVHYTA